MKAKVQIFAMLVKFLLNFARDMDMCMSLYNIMMARTNLSLAL